MENQEIYEKIINMYDDPKSKKFVIHLIHSYVPIQVNASKFVDDDKYKGKKLKCAITNQPLLTINEVFNRFNANSGKIQEEFLNDIKYMASHDGEYNPDRNKTLKEMMNGHVVAWTGTDTDTLLCEQAVVQLQEFVTMRLLHGDREINNIVRRKMNTPRF